jgi:iron-sulfur cluster assembly accessory protein
MKIDIDFKVSDQAVQEIKKVIQESEELDDTTALRVFAKSGCSGIFYGLEFIDFNEITPNDSTEELSGLKLVIDKKSLLQLDDIVLEWVDSGEQQGFKFNSVNKTNIKEGCGGGSCGGCSSK